MRFAFLLFKYFPYGGLQRDFFSIAQRAVARGHQVDVYTMIWEGPRPENLNIHLINTRALSSHGRMKTFARQLESRLAAEAYGAVVGFNKLPGLDVYFAADGCFLERVADKHFYRLLPRYRALESLERAVFGPDADAEILLLSDTEKARYIRHYATPAARFHLAPPDIAADRIVERYDPQARVRAREALGLPAQARLLLAISSAFKTKGLDRTIMALAALPQALQEGLILLVVGEDDAEFYLKLARRHGVQQQVRFFGARDDVPDFLLAADLLVHPARYENAGTVLLEAMGSGLPVIASAACGYAFHVARADAGVVIAEPFRQQDFNQELERLLSSTDLPALGKKGLAYIQSLDVSGRADFVIDAIETKAKRKKAT